MNPHLKSGEIIKNLSLKEHKKILIDLEKFWVSQTAIIKPHHHPLYSLLFSDFSFVLYDNTRIVSYVYAAHNNKRGFIHLIAARAGEYRKGYASALLHHIENTAREKKLKSIWVYALPENVLSKNFFTRNSYIMQKEISISSDERRVLYHKRL